MLNHNQGVTQVAQTLQGANKALIIALMQTDRGLIKHIQHPHQARTNLGGQANTLGFTTRERGRAARKRQIIQTHINQETQAGVNLSQHCRSNLGGSTLQLELRHELT